MKIDCMSRPDTQAPATPLFAERRRQRRWSMVVITGVDGILCDDTRGLAAVTGDALAALKTAGVPLVLVGGRSADELRALQQQADIHAPFICDDGASLFVPCGYFDDAVGGAAGEWDVVDFSRRTLAARTLVHARANRSPTRALSLLLSLYRACDARVIVVGLGDGQRDHALLRQMDVPIVIRSSDARPERLGSVEALPGAFLTHQCGPTGWNEAILGWTGV